MYHSLIHPKHFAYRVWHSASGPMYWCEMSTSHIMSCVRFIERRALSKPAEHRIGFGNCDFCYPHPRYSLAVARDLQRYVAWREKAHA